MPYQHKLPIKSLFCGIEVSLTIVAYKNLRIIRTVDWAKHSLLYLYQDLTLIHTSGGMGWTNITMTFRENIVSLSINSYYY